MNWLDILLAVALVIPTFIGFRVGIIKAVLFLTGLVIGVFLAGNLYGPLAGMLDFLPSAGAANIAAFILILVVVMIAATILARVLKFIASVLMLGWVNHLGGGALGLLAGLILWSAILATWVKFFGSGLVTESLIAKVLLDQFPMILALLPSDFDVIRGFFE